MVVESKLDVELSTAPFWFLVRQTPSPAARVRASRCGLPLSMVLGRLAPLALEARFSCSLVTVVVDGLRSLNGARRTQLPATYGPRLPRAAGSCSSASHAGAAASTAARDGGSSVGASGVGGVWQRRRMRRRHRQRMRRWRRVRLRKRRRRLLHTRRIRRRRWRPKPPFLYQ